MAVGAEGLEVGGVVGCAALVERYAVVNVEPVGVAAALASVVISGFDLFAQLLEPGRVADEAAWLDPGSFAFVGAGTGLASAFAPVGAVERVVGLAAVVTGPHRGKAGRVWHGDVRADNGPHSSRAVSCRSRADGLNPELCWPDACSESSDHGQRGAWSRKDRRWRARLYFFGCLGGNGTLIVSAGCSTFFTGSSGRGRFGIAQSSPQPSRLTASSRVAPSPTRASVRFVISHAVIGPGTSRR